MKALFREKVYSAITPRLNGTFVVMDLDLKSCFSNILFGLSRSVQLAVSQC